MTTDSTSPRMAAIWRWRTAEAAVLALATFLRFYRIGATSLWSDEGNTWALIQRSAAEIAAHAAADIHPPGYYWLLKTWSLLFGTSAVAMRSFSALCGVLLVWLIARIAAQLVTQASAWPGARRWLPLLAALVAALNPFQIYYSQEARMYMLLALAAALLLWALLLLFRHESRPAASWRTTAPALVLYVVAAVVGLWTHYSFPIVLLAAGIAWLVWWLRSGHTMPPLLRFSAINALALLTFMPWLPTAIRQLTTWPAGGESLLLLDGLRLTVRTLLLGLMHVLPAPDWLWLGAAALLPLLGALALRRARGVLALSLWLALPIVMMALFGLFTDAFLKFLLVASAPWCVLVAASSELGGSRLAAWLRALLAIGAALFAALALPAYWQDANARDNYAAVARYIAATGDPASEMVLLNAPGQADVWRYYDPAFPVLPIPDTRPADPARVDQQLTAWTSGRAAVHALLWATEQSDPGNFVTDWLDTHLFKGQEVWQNNIRYAQYFVAESDSCYDPFATAPRAESAISLMTVCQPGGAKPNVASGTPFMIELAWRADAPIARRYKVSVQILQGDTVLAQHDGEPAGGSRPTDGWQPGDVIIDRHAVLVPVGTVPGPKYATVTVYDAETGARVPINGVDSFGGFVTVTLPAVNPPIEMLPMQEIVDKRMGAVQLLGYSQYKKDFGHAPETPLTSGDTLRLTLFWQAPDPLPEGWEPDQQVTLTLGGSTVTLPLAAIDYPTEEWQPGQIVRGEFDLEFDGAERRVRLTAGDETIRLQAIP